MNRTSIEWIVNPDGSRPGWSWNPVTGCLNGCDYCYARKLAHGRLKQRYLANKNWNTATPKGYEGYPNLDPFYPRFWEERLLPLHTPRRADSPKKGIFVCDMSELFGDWIPQSWQEQVFNAIKANPDYRFYLLTKQAQNLIKWSPFPDNCYVGVTATDFHMFGLALLHLSTIEAKIKYISFEPLLGRILSESIGGYNSKFLEVDLAHHINWLIIGAQTNPYKPPDIEWVQEIVEAADKAGVKVFLKDNLMPLIDANCPAESNLVPNRNRLFRMKHPTLCLDCEGEQCHECGAIWKSRQELPE